jgi:FixJ family two-component response regulator
LIRETDRRQGRSRQSRSCTQKTLAKEAGPTLGINPRTFDFHSADLLKKLGARNAADLVHKVLGE